MAKNDLIPVKHMYDSAMEAFEMARGKSLDEIKNERMLNLSLVRLIEVMGEAANRVTQKTQRGQGHNQIKLPLWDCKQNFAKKTRCCRIVVQSKYPEVPWKKIISMPNQLIHGYDIIDIEILYQTINEDLPPLIASLEKIIPQEEK